MKALENAAIVLEDPSPPRPKPEREPSFNPYDGGPAKPARKGGATQPTAHRAELVAEPRVNTVPTKTGSFNITRLRYKAAFDAYRTISSRHSALLRSGGELSQQQRADEERATAELKVARDDMNAASSRLAY